MADAQEMFRAFARMVAVEVVALMRPEAPKPYTQDDLPLGMTKGTYLDHCRRGDWKNRKIGRLRETERAEFDAWRAAHPEKGAIKIAKLAPEAANDETYDVEAHLRATSKPARRRVG